MINNHYKIKAIFSDQAKFIAAVKSLAGKNDISLEVFSPMPMEEVSELLPQKPSGVRWFTFIGGIFGLFIGFAFPIYTVNQWPLMTGGKPMVTTQAFIIIAFELTILFGAIFTLLGLLFHARLPRHKLVNYDVRFSENSYGIFITSQQNQVEEIKALVNQADEVVLEEIKNIERGSNGFN
jgi:hypothetical protein